MAATGKALYDACHGNLPDQARDIALKGVGFVDYADENVSFNSSVNSLPHIFFVDRTDDADWAWRDVTKCNISIFPIENKRVHAQ